MRDEHAESPAALREREALWSLLVRILASVTERTAGVSVGSVRSMSSLIEVLIEVVGELDQQWMINSQLHLVNYPSKPRQRVRRSGGNTRDRLNALSPRVRQRRSQRVDSSG